MSTSKKVALMILIGIIYFVIDTLLQAGYFKSIKNHFNGEEIAVYTGIYGPEDLEWDRENNVLFISSLDRRAKNSGYVGQSDGIYVLHTDIPNAKPQLLKTDLAVGFQPHGISVFKQNDKTFLYAINHYQKDSSVELFEFSNSTLKHVETYSGIEMFSPNDIVGDEIGKFYVTNDHGNRTSFWRTIEDYLRMPYSYVLYYNGSEFSKAHQGMVYANGIQFSNDGSKLYTSHTIGHEVFVLDRNKETGILIHKKTVDVGSGLDNIDVDENGLIWVTGHPKLFDFLDHAKDSKSLSPSQIFTINPDDDYSVSKIYENDGSQISGSSTAVVKNDTIFVGCVFDEKLLKLHIEKP